jgi:uncharacterized membrane protein
MEHDNQHRLKELSFSSSRIEALTDGIFAFAMTLLVLNLNVPELHGAVTNEELIEKLQNLEPRFFIFLLSFFVLASAWAVHHRQFSYIKGSNNTLGWINMVRLLCVIVVPFSSVLIGTYPDLPISALFFSANVLLLNVITLIEWKYAVAKGFVPELGPDHLKATDIKTLYSIVIAALALAFSFILAANAMWIFLLGPLGLALLKRAGKIV